MSGLDETGLAASRARFVRFKSYKTASQKAKEPKMAIAAPWLMLIMLEIMKIKNEIGSQASEMANDITDYFRGRNTNRLISPARPGPAQIRMVSA